MFELGKAQIGDVLLYRVNNLVGGIITFFTLGGGYSHASVYIGNGRIIESHIGTGVVEVKLPKMLYKDITIKRYKSRLTSDEKKSLVEWFESKVGSDYELEAFPSSFFRSTIGKLFGMSGWRKQEPILNNKNKYYCSELVATGYQKAINIDIAPNVHEQSTTPDDLGRSKVLKRVG